MSVVASYSELYEEGEVEHINGPALCFPTQMLIMHISAKKQSWYKMDNENRNNTSIALIKRPKCEERVMEARTHPWVCLMKMTIIIDSIDYVTRIGNGSRDPIELNEHLKTHFVSKKIN